MRQCSFQYNELGYTAIYSHRRPVARPGVTKVCMLLLLFGAQKERRSSFYECADRSCSMSLWLPMVCCMCAFDTFSISIKMKNDV